MNIKLLCVTVCLLLALAPARALAEEEPIIYTVKPGDTLWDISERFIKDPFYWPNLWANNTQINNPHLIYPGQKLRIYGDRIEIIPLHEEAPQPSGEEVAVLTDDELQLVPTFSGATSHIISREEDGLGTLVDTIDNRFLMGELDTIFLDMKDLAAVQPGDRYSLGAIAEKVFHPHTGKLIGYRLNELGTIEITEIAEEVAVAKITESIREIRRGAIVLPYQETPDRIPRLISPLLLEGTIVAADETKRALGQWDVIHIDLGAGDGLEVGHELKLSRRREATRAAQKLGTTPKLPLIDLGEAIVLEVRNDFAEALITRPNNLAVFRGDHVQTKVK